MAHGSWCHILPAVAARVTTISPNGQDLIDDGSDIVTGLRTRLGGQDTAWGGDDWFGAHYQISGICILINTLARRNESNNTDFSMFFFRNKIFHFSDTQTSYICSVRTQTIYCTDTVFLRLIIICNIVAHLQTIKIQKIKTLDFSCKQWSATGCNLCQGFGNFWDWEKKRHTPIGLNILVV